jgi:hypothetical protein
MSRPKRGGSDVWEREAERPARDWFEVLARTADTVAETAEMSARVHDNAAGHLPGAAEHAQRERRLAAAERAAAAAYRNHAIPPKEVMQTIRAGASLTGSTT